MEDKKKVSDEKKIAIIAVAAVIIIALLFSFAPTLKERTEKIKSYSKNNQEKEEEKREEPPFKARFLAWDTRKNTLYVDYYFINNESKTVESVDLECYSFDEHKTNLDTLKKSLQVRMKSKSQEAFKAIKMGEVNPKTEQVGCAVTNYK